jgi:hypothetical protein
MQSGTKIFENIFLRPNTSNEEEILTIFGVLHNGKQEFQDFKVDITFARCIPLDNCTSLECVTSKCCRHMTTLPIATFDESSTSFENIFALWWKILKFCVAHKVFANQIHLNVLQLKVYKL